jgi:hypothetical protein
MKPGDLVRLKASYYSDADRDSIGIVLQTDTSSMNTTTTIVRVVFPNLVDWFPGVHLEVIDANPVYKSV